MPLRAYAFNGADTWLSVTDGVPDITATSTLAQLAVLGDSLTVGMGEAALRSAFSTYDTSNLLWDGLGGRTVVAAGGGSTPSSETVINGWRTAGQHPRVWLVGLITNDYGRTEANWRADIKTLLDLINVDPVERVLWVGPAYGPTANATVLAQTPTMRTVLADIAATTDTAKKPAGMDFRYFDLHAAFQAIDQTGLWDLGDTTGRHHTTAGYAKRLELVKAWFDGIMAGGSGGTGGAALPQTVPFTI